MSLDANKDQSTPTEAPRLEQKPDVQILQSSSSTQPKETQTNELSIPPEPISGIVNYSADNHSINTASSQSTISEIANSNPSATKNAISPLQKVNPTEISKETINPIAKPNLPLLSVEYLMSPNTKPASPTTFHTNSIRHGNPSPIIIHQAPRNLTTNVQTSTKSSNNSPHVINPPQEVKRPLQPPLPMIQIPKISHPTPTILNGPLPLYNQDHQQIVPFMTAPQQKIQYPTPSSPYPNNMMPQNIPFQQPYPKSNNVYQVYSYHTPYFVNIQPSSPTIQPQVNQPSPHIGSMNTPHPIAPIPLRPLPGIQPIPTITQLPPIPHINQISTVQNVSIPPSNTIEQPPNPIRIGPTPTPQIIPISTQSANTERNQPPADNPNPMPIKTINQPLPQPIVSRHPLPSPVVNKPLVETQNEMKPPTPTYYTDKDSGEYGVRCVCGEGHIDCMLVQCDMCDFWLHGLCINVARETKGEQYYCPFCLQRKIRCKCKENMKYSEPIIQCSKCGFWVHKSCEDLDYGINPDKFVCSFCGGSTYELPKVFFDKDDGNFDYQAILNNEQRQSIVNAIPDGLFKNKIMEDLNNTEISFKEFVPRYFHEFAPLLFQPSYEFWRVIVDTFSALFEVEKSTILTAFDVLATHLLYKDYNFNRNGRTKLVKTLTNSESIADLLKKSDSFPRLEKSQTPVRPYVNKGHVYTPMPLDDGTLIYELPGFLMHSDEVRAENGIPLNCITVTNTDLCIDVESSAASFAPSIHRSFHFNCVLKMVRIKGELRVGLFATTMRKAPYEEKSRRGPAIPADNEMFLPFDGFIPYQTQKIEWKDKKPRGPGRHATKHSSDTASNKDDDSSPKTITRSTERKVTRNKSQEKNQPSSSSSTQNTNQNGRKSLSRSASNANLDQMNLTLLNSFYDSAVPPMPFILLENQDAVDRYIQQQEIRSRTRSSRGNRHRYSE